MPARYRHLKWGGDSLLFTSKHHISAWHVTIQIVLHFQPSWSRVWLVTALADEITAEILQVISRSSPENHHYLPGLCLCPFLSPQKLGMTGTKLEAPWKSYTFSISVGSLATVLSLWKVINCSLDWVRIFWVSSL